MNKLLKLMGFVMIHNFANEAANEADLSLCHDLYEFNGNMDEKFECSSQAW